MTAIVGILNKRGAVMAADSVGCSIMFTLGIAV